MALPGLPIPADLAYDEPPVTDENIDAYLDSADETEEAQPWRILDDGAAEWSLRRIAAIDDETAALAERSEAWRTRIQDWFDHAANPLARRRAFFVAHLERYAYDQRLSLDRKTVSLPSGVVKSRESKAAVVVADETAVLAWAKANLVGDALASVVKTVESVQLTGLRVVVHADAAAERAVTADGEVVPGCEVRSASVSFTVSVS